MLTVSSAIFVADTKMISSHNFGASLSLIKEVYCIFKVESPTFKEKCTSAVTGD